MKSNPTTIGRTPRPGAAHRACAGPPSPAPTGPDFEKQAPGKSATRLYRKSAGKPCGGASHADCQKWLLGIFRKIEKKVCKPGGFASDISFAEYIDWRNSWIMKKGFLDSAGFCCYAAKQSIGFILMAFQ
ncbi:hypothetical protein [Vandammella animalimorsus]|uniref:hypothetical protein n=1 Tax=Vandammella animalimorsus TaxID=2029117 RepID=UPI001178BB79|nr:hypothetical protein [Vandammella animalimorsus]